AAKILAASLLVSILDIVAQVRPSIAICQDANKKGGISWRKHPLTPLLAEMLRAGYLASTTPSGQSWRLCCLGQGVLRRLLAQFGDVEDPAMPGENLPILAIYQAQISSAFMPALGSAMSETMVPLFVRQAAVDTAAAYVVSGLVYNDQAAFVRILRLVAPQLLFSKEGGGRVGGAVTAQMLVALRLAALGSWAGIYCYASSRDDRRLLDVAGLHFGVLGRAWVEAIRDAAVLEINMVDVLDELENLQKMQGRGAVGRDIGAGLCLGLESTYVEIVREPLKSWYRHYLPLIVEAVSLAMRDGRLDLALEEQADFKPALLILGFALQKLASATAMDNGDDEDNRVRSSLAADLPPVCALVRRLVGSFSLETPDTVCRISAGKRQWRIGSLLETVRVLLDNSAKYRISGALVPATAGGSLWLAQAIWAHAVGRWLVAHAEPTFAAARALGVADSLLSLLARIPGNRSSSTLLVDWLFEPDHLAAHAGDSADMAGSLGLSSAGRLVLRDLLCLWNKNIGSGSANIDVLCRCLSALALVTGTVCRAGTHEKAARNLVSLWLVLWKKSLKDNIGSSSFGISDARGLSECLFRLFDSANQSGLQSAATTDTAATAAALSSGGLDDLISGDDLSAFTWVGKAASNALCEMLADCRDNGRGD
ncbi:hypothetical protein LPJ56_004497, partial [Coemansia sp. RSA 2599]